MIDKRNIPLPPRAASSVVWTFFGTAMWIFLVWAGDLILHDVAIPEYADFRGGHPLTVRHILLGGMWLPIGLYSVWAWKPRQKHASWHRWIVALLVVLYPSGIMMLFGILLWDILLPGFWGKTAKVIMVAMYCMSWALPAISYPLAKRLKDKSRTLDLIVWGGPTVLIAAGLLGGSIGMHSKDTRVWVLAFSPLFAIGWAQYAAAYLWPYRPWAKEEK